MPLSTRCRVDALGNHLFIKRCGRQDAPKILIDTHLDEIGMMVNGYRDDGFLTVAKWAAWIPAYCLLAR